MNEADTRDPESVCDVDGCNAWRQGEHNYCYHHKGLEKGPESDNGAPEGNQNATKHGLHSDPINLLESIREEDEHAYAWIQDKFESYLEVAPFERGSAHADQLLQICVREFTIWKASGIQVDKGVITKQKKAAGDAIFKVDVDNPANKALDRMERTVVKRLDKLGVMPSPEAKEAEAKQSFAESWAEGLRQ